MRVIPQTCRRSRRECWERLLFAVDLALQSGCRVQGAVSGVLNDILREAEALLLERLGGISLADLAAEVREWAGERHSNDGAPHVAREP